jgi:hypothetical protein
MNLDTRYVLVTLKLLIASTVIVILIPSLRVRILHGKNRRLFTSKLPSTHATQLSSHSGKAYRPSWIVSLEVEKGLPCPAYSSRHCQWHVKVGEIPAPACHFPLIPRIRSLQSQNDADNNNFPSVFFLPYTAFKQLLVPFGY